MRTCYVLRGLMRRATASRAFLGLKDADAPLYRNWCARMGGAYPELGAGPVADQQNNALALKTTVSSRRLDRGLSFGRRIERLPPVPTVRRGRFQALMILWLSPVD